MPIDPMALLALITEQHTQIVELRAALSTAQQAAQQEAHRGEPV